MWKSIGFAFVKPFFRLFFSRMGLLKIFGKVEREKAKKSVVE